MTDNIFKKPNILSDSSYKKNTEEGIGSKAVCNLQRVRECLTEKVKFE